MTSDENYKFHMFHKRCSSNSSHLPLNMMMCATTEPLKPSSNGDNHQAKVK